MASIGYRMITRHGHPNAYTNGRIWEHVFIMSEMLGRPLTALEVVHHKDENKQNNHPDNLQLFATSALHQRHHAEERALATCGNRLFMKCAYCGEYEDTSSMYIRPSQYQAWHTECHVKVALKTRATPEGKAKANAASAKAYAKRKLSQQSIGI